MGDRDDYILFSGGAPGAEMAFGENAERLGIEEVNFAFEGHVHVRTRGLRILNHEELRAGDVSLDYVSRLMNRRYTDAPTIRKVLQRSGIRSTTARRSTSSARCCPTTPSRAAPAGARSSPSCATSRSSSSTRTATAGSRGRASRWVPCPAGEPVIRHTALHRHRHAAPRRQRQGGHRGALRPQLQRVAVMWLRRGADLQRPQPDGCGRPVPGRPASSATRSTGTLASSPARRGRRP